MGMNDVSLFNEKTMTTAQVAEQLHTSSKVILENARKCLPNKRIENGKPTQWTQKEITVLVEQVKCNQPNGRTFPNLSVELKGLERCERNSAITTMQFAKQLGTSPNVVLENARKCLPNKRIENGKTTYWTQAEITILLDYMKSHTSNNRSVELNSTVAITSTDLTPALKIKKAMELMQEGYEEELQILRAKNLEQEKKLAIAEPKAKWYDDFGDGTNLFEIGAVGKELEPYGLGALKIFDRLKADKIIYEKTSDGVKSYYAYFSYKKYFAYRNNSFTRKDGKRISYQRLMFNALGKQWILGKYKATQNAD